MTIEDALSLGTIDRTDREVLLAYLFGKDRTWLLGHQDDTLSDDQEQSYQSMVQRRNSGEPVAYIVGSREFFGRSFTVNSSVLIPRPSTELLVEQMLHVLAGREIEKVKEVDAGIVAWSEIKDAVSDVQLIIDIGTGSGCIAVTLACEKPHLHFIATDSSEDALAVAQENAKQHHVDDRIECKHEKNFESLTNIKEPFLIISNPPYIPEGEVLERDVQDFEPHSALFAGKEGSDVLREIVRIARYQKFCRGFVVECREEQAR